MVTDKTSPPCIAHAAGRLSAEMGFETLHMTSVSCRFSSLFVLTFISVFSSMKSRVRSKPEKKEESAEEKGGEAKERAQGGVPAKEAMASSPRQHQLLPARTRKQASRFRAS